MRDATGSEDEASGGRLKRLVSHVEGHLPVEDVPGLVLTMMNMERWLGCPKGQGFDECEPLFGLWGGQLDREPPAQRPHRDSFAGPKQKRLTLTRLVDVRFLPSRCQHREKGRRGTRPLDLLDVNQAL